MTNSHTLTLRSLDIPRINKFGVGFEDMFNDLMRLSAQHAESSYPPYNLLKYSDDHYAFEFAVAGFEEGEISVTIDKNHLIVEGAQATDLDEQVEFLHRGIGARNFARSFRIAEHVKVSSATVSNGILTIDLIREIPEEQKPKKIAITYNK